MPTSIKKKLTPICDGLIEHDLQKNILAGSILTNLVKERDNEIIWDVTNGFEQAYESIAEEVADLDPDYIVCPVGSGEGFVGIYQGIKKYKLKTKLIGVTPTQSTSIADKLTCIWTPYRKEIERITQEKDNQVIKITEEQIEENYQSAQKYLTCEPSSAVVFGALKNVPLEKDVVILLINSGSS